MIPDMSIKKGWRVNQFFTAFIVNLAAFAQGVVIGWPSPVMPSLQSSHSPIGINPMTDEETSWLGSLLCLGALVGTPVFTHLANHYSRKMTGYLLGVPSVISWLMVILAKSEPVLYLARFIVGFSGAGNVILCPLYVSEMADDNIRGTLGTYMMLFTNAGVVFSYLVGFYSSYLIFSCVCLIMPVAFLVGFFFLPESPVYLLKQGKYYEAEKALYWFKSGDKESVNMAIEEIVNSPESPPSRLTQLRFFRESGGALSRSSSTIVIGVLQLFSVLTTSFLIDRAGRKILLLISNLLSSTCLCAFGIYLYLKSRGIEVAGYEWAPVVCLSLYVVAVSLGIGPVPLLIMSEIFSPGVRAIAMTISLCFLWVASFLVCKFFPDLYTSMGLFGCCWLFAGSCFVFGLLEWAVVVETKNRSFESISRELNGNKSKKDVILSKSAIVYVDS
ncbi:unnamed protein product [Timema podura]|uniref:Major facilitator superfamily (MFS) profile domain-containing protein n=1 Tax=Timema podura TaxID=61482 RepID=A0ABN7NVI9_TIMPD|nr:unnamed protein product [Timema podura]